MTRHASRAYDVNRSSEARGLAFTTQFLLSGPGGGAWVMRVADERCEVRPGTVDTPDLTVRMPALLFLAIHRGDASPAWGLVTGRIRLAGRRRLFLHFPRLFPTEASSSTLARWLFLARRSFARRRGSRDTVSKAAVR